MNETLAVLAMLACAWLIPALLVLIWIVVSVPLIQRKIAALRRDVETFQPFPVAPPVLSDDECARVIALSAAIRCALFGWPSHVQERDSATIPALHEDLTTLTENTPE